MSYLDRPRIHFAGTFRASPATVNNTPNNYNPANYNQNTFNPEKIELYWEPKGDSIFDLVDCQVTSAEIDSFVSKDSLLGAPVAAMYTDSPPKLVDLDPMQQNGSEIWGLTLRLGGFSGAYVQGIFTPIAFNGIWMNSQGENTPRSSASGAASYLSTLTNLTWNTGSSAVLRKLHDMSPDRLSIRLAVSAHNCAPQIYAFTDETFVAMTKRRIPQDVLDKIEPLKEYFMNLDEGQPKSPGYIPTIEYVNYLLAQLLDQGEIDQYGKTILDVTKEPYVPWINYETGQPLGEDPEYDFNYGKIVGSVGPCLVGEPSFVVPARTLSPVPAPQRQTTETPPEPPLEPPPPPGPSGWWAQAKLVLAPTPSLTLDLANSLPVQLPGRPPWHAALGTLSLAYVTGSGPEKEYITIVDPIDYANPEFIDKQSGMLVVTNFGTGVDPNDLATHPLAVLRTITEGGVLKTYPFLEECPTGWSLRADQFLYRMNPGMETTPGFAQGQTNTVDFYVRKFGEIPTTAVNIGLSILDSSQAKNYTLSTLGTSGTNGIADSELSMPPGKLKFSQSSVAVQNGKATVTITGLDPGNPRGYVDGQVYFTTYNFSPEVEDFHQDPNDLVSVQIYQQNPITGPPTWVNGIGNILRQYGMLYPIMGRFQLWTYEGVVENNVKIQRVLGMDISQPLYMPVTRDLSAIRRKLIMDWFDAGMPHGDQVGPAGGPGTSWNNLPEVSTWGPLTGLEIHAGDLIDSIAPVYGTQTATPQGGSGGTRYQVDFTGEPVVTISGVTGIYFDVACVGQLTFTTAGGKTHGPFGTLKSVGARQPFTLSVPAGFRINSFFGTTPTAGMKFIAAIGGNVLAT